LFVGARLLQEPLSSTTRSYISLRNRFIIYVVEKVRREKWRATGLGPFLNLISKRSCPDRGSLFVAPGRGGPLSALEHWPWCLVMDVGSSLRLDFACFGFEIWRVLNFLIFVHLVLCCGRRRQPLVLLLEQGGVHAEEETVTYRGHGEAF